MTHIDSALVGFTGFVGQTLRRLREFDTYYNSSNSQDMAGKSYGQIVFSAARAEKWRANAAPDADAGHIDSLIDLISSFQAESFVLISTIDVYVPPWGVDERSPAHIGDQEWHAYGRNRFRLEMAVRDRFPSALIVRLPALFGQGLRKNALYDLMNDNDVDRLNPDGEFQFYNMEHLFRDITRSQELGIELLNICSEPVSLKDISREIFDIDISTNPSRNPARYNVTSIHSNRWGGSNYLYSRDLVMRELAEFVEMGKIQR